MITNERHGTISLYELLGTLSQYGRHEMYHNMQGMVTYHNMIGLMMYHNMKGIVYN